MFLYGEKIINDHDIGNLLTFLISSKAIKDRDYYFLNSSMIVLKKSKLIYNSKFCYYYKLVNISKENPYIGRCIDHKNRIITDCVFNKELRYTMGISPPWTLNWNYDFECSSVSKWIMEIVSKIPFEYRNNIEYVCTYISSNIDSINNYNDALIEGRWKSTFSQGKEPDSWKRSHEIFKERAELKRPVKYGQCWVLADLLTGIFRFLGIPAKTVKIDNCIIDIYRSGGIDYIDHSDKINIKSNDKINFRHIINEDSFEYCENKELDIDPLEKGCLFSYENDIETDDKDFYKIGNEEMLKKKNSSWNFHVWTEVLLNNEWCIFDPSPLHCVDTFIPYIKDKRCNEFINKKFFGPIPIKYIREGKIPENYPLIENFKYLFTCVNGTIRKWCPLVNNSRDKFIMYLSDINYNFIKVYERSVNGSKLDVTKRYRCNYENLHYRNPLYFSIIGNDITQLMIYNRNYPIGEYVVQICILTGNIPLYIHREKYQDITNIDFLLFLRKKEVMKYRKIADKITIMIYDCKNDNVYFQGIRA